MTADSRIALAGSSVTHRLSSLGIAAVAYFVLAVVALHLLDTEFDPVAHHVSNYALGTRGWLMASAFLVVGSGTVALALGLRRVLAPGRRVPASVTLLVIAALGFVLSGIFEAPVPLEDGSIEITTLGGLVHVVAGVVILSISVVVGAFLLSGVFRRDPAWRHLTRTARVFAWALLIGYLATGATSSAPDPAALATGVVQRVFVGTIMAWLVFLGWQVREHLGAAAPRA